MNIIWQPNPLHTRVELDDNDLKHLRLRVRIEELEGHLGSAAFCLKEGERFDIERARREVAYEAWEGDESPLSKRVEELVAHYVEELSDGVHCGDCTCVPMTCSKCLAEEMLGISTIAGAGKHGLYKIDGAFGKQPSGDVNEAIRHLENYDPKAAWKGWEAHAPRWKREAAHAAKWLKGYRDEHFASADTRPEGGDSTKIEAPFTGGAVGSEASETPTTSPSSPSIKLDR